MEKSNAPQKDLVDKVLTNEYIKLEELQTPGDFNVDEFLVSKRYLGLDGLEETLYRKCEELNDELLQYISNNYQKFVSMGTKMHQATEKIQTLLSQVDRLKQELQNLNSLSLEKQNSLQLSLEEKKKLNQQLAECTDLQTLKDNLELLASIKCNRGLWFTTLREANLLCEKYEHIPWVSNVKTELKTFQKTASL
ncbi:hypothetical protein SJAG_00578 [Schizosaccharomyces japonicus yFS275]|uniref:Conserved oligomeric Golgi complex subunit 2 n=1 Tax=Schizosaccharomyces japonicus (strain yFS275 / FY16936) TaxID=402676 RepID=B6JW11_SCHJY|nr:hypothetical protein SJAG_00578 [Schizosaccharomyces japonicus yFS275]EEB05562.1 hypothetical protein SJAG_00578 [Schizosaccharomyces japonicus yFS275]